LLLPLLLVFLLLSCLFFKALEHQARLRTSTITNIRRLNGARARPASLGGKRGVVMRQAELHVGGEGWRKEAGGIATRGKQQVGKASGPA